MKSVYCAAALLSFLVYSLSGQAFELGDSDAAATVVDFHIPAGTGMGPWNNFKNPIVVRVGQILRFHNDDDVPHFLHTNGKPCPHGTNAFEPGETYDCLIQFPHKASDEDLYDHEYGADSQVYIQANP